MNMKQSKPLFYLCVLVALMAVSCAKPDALTGPEPNKSAYGPQDITWELPHITGTIHFVSPDGNPQSEGRDINSPTTIEAAVSRVVSGDAIVMRGGIYRTGNLTFNQGIIIQPYGNERPVLNGTLVATDWRPVSDSLWYTPWDRLFPGTPEPWWRAEREEQFTPLHRFNNDHVFIDGQFLQSVGSRDEVCKATFFVDYDAGRVYIGANPAGRLVEITAYRKAIFRTIADVHGKQCDGRGPIIRGLTITQYPDTMVHIDGYYPQGVSPETAHGKDVVGTVFEHTTFSKSLRIGVFAIGDSMVMRHCRIVDTNTEGLYVVASSYVLLERNIFENNNIERWTGFYPAAVKIFNQSHRVTCRGNLVINHPYSHGIWYDVGNEDGIFVNNWLENIGKLERSPDDRTWPMNGFFFEISHRAICAGNVFMNCEQSLLVLNARGVEIHNNTFINSPVSFGRNSRGDEPDHFGWHPDTGPRVEERDGHTLFNNLFYMDGRNNRPMVGVWQPDYLCERLSQPQLLAMDGNLFIRKDTTSVAWARWSPYANERCEAELFSPADLHALHPHMSAHCRYLPAHTEAVFTNLEQMDFRLIPNFAAQHRGLIIPQHVAQAVGWNGNNLNFVGAYPNP